MANRSLLSARVSRRQMLKASLIGVGALAAAAGALGRLETLAAAQPGLGRWRRLAPNSAPSSRSYMAMAYDGSRRVPVLFSGAGADADTWIWDGSTWARQNPSLSPPSRSGASFVYHTPTQKVVLFAGGNAKGFLGDTWLWDGKTSSALPGLGPPARIGAS